MVPCSIENGIKIRIKIIYSLLVLIALLLAARFFYLQVVRHDHYLEKARNIYITSRETHGKRGEIFDCNGYLLVGNAPCMEISATPANIRTPELRLKTAKLMAEYLDRDFDYYYKKLSPTISRRQADGKIVEKPNSYQMISRFAPIDTSLQLRGKLRELGINSNTVSFRDTSRRTYPKGRLMANVLGFTNIVDDDSVPQSGLEKELNPEITQKSGKMLFTRARDGEKLDYGVNFDQQSQDGKNVYLTISEPIQAILEEELDQAMIDSEPNAIYAAIADPATGKILALAQRPSIDPNDRKTFTPEAIRTRIAEDAYEPGSVVKALCIGKALDWGIVTPDMHFDGENGYWKEEKISDTRKGGYGNMDVSEVIQHSSNIGTGKIAQLMGKEQLYQALRIFGCGEKTGLPFPVESSGRIRPVSKWDRYSLTRFSIGYGVLWTPLQLLRAYCGIANGGMMPQLRLIDHFEDTRTGEITTPPVEMPRRVFQNPKTSEILTDMMIKVTQPGGTARRAAIPGFDVAGKTGTSHKVINGKYSYLPSTSMASFIGFVPAKNPKLVMLVTVDCPHRGHHHGGSAAGPVFSRTAKRVLQYMNIQPDKPIPGK